MSKQLWGRLRASPVVLGLNLFILISPFIDWRPVIQETTQKLYFVFGVIALYILSLFFKPKRYLQDWRIGIFALWALFLMFWHSQIWVDSVTFRYLNFYLMSEGFIHVFCGIILYRLIYEYADKLPALWFALTIYIGKGFFIKSLTPIFAVAICGLIWCIAKKKWWIAGVVLLWAVLFIIGEWNYICLKWSCRPYVWKIVIKQIFKHPFIGYGFDKNLMSNMILGLRGWNFIHNDYLNLFRDLGLPAIIMIILFLKDFIKNFKIDLLFLLCLGSLIVSFFQTTMYFPRNAIIVIPFFALWRVKYGLQ